MNKNIIISIFFIMLISWLQACLPMKRGVNTEVMSIENVLDKTIAGYEICGLFALTKEDVIKYFSVAKQVNGYEFHHGAIILPCKYQGLIDIDGELLQWEIIAGGAGYLYNDKLINERYLCKGNCCNELPNLCQGSQVQDMWSKLETHLNSPACIPEKGILKAEHLGEYKLEIWFEENKDVSIQELDFLPILEEDSGKAFRPLLNKERFGQVVGRYNLTWLDSDAGEYNQNAIDIQPEAIKWFCNKFGRLVKA